MLNTIRYKILFALIGLSSGVVAAQAQQPVVKASLDSTYVIIGSPTKIHLEATVDQATTLLFPHCIDGIQVFDDTIVYTLEVTEQSAIDTIDAGNGRLTLRQDITVFPFDSANLYIPAFPFVSGSDTLYTNDLALKVVVPFEVEVDPQKYHDIKDPLEPAFVFWDYLNWFLWPLLAILLCAGGYWYYRYYMARKRARQEGFVPAAPVLPPHDLAMQALSELDDKKLWQRGFTKQYYSELTAILRIYIEGRFRVPAMEKTSDEILDEMRAQEEVSKSSLHNLQQIFQTADLVKFAKYVSLPEENDLSFMNVKMFVSSTVEVKSVDTSAVVAEGKEDITNH